MRNPWGMSASGVLNLPIFLRPFLWHHRMDSWIVRVGMNFTPRDAKKSMVTFLVWKKEKDFLGWLVKHHNLALLRLIMEFNNIPVISWRCDMLRSNQTTKLLKQMEYNQECTRIVTPRSTEIVISRSPNLDTPQKQVPCMPANQNRNEKKMCL